MFRACFSSYTWITGKGIIEFFFFFLFSFLYPGFSSEECD